MEYEHPRTALQLLLDQVEKDPKRFNDNFEAILEADDKVQEETRRGFLDIFSRLVKRLETVEAETAKLKQRVSELEKAVAKMPHEVGGG